ncbi:class II aldolase/adducin family protein [Sinorhizobium numidicum]|uniref:Class II aldolase/adducin family protein n=1 Tax=Sinorhizobium numidicum TaxID=680248 RepID=A0ABY8CWH7_9HYPH|nr:class II aldolase/adducin family protein [Sinorhizobium numidicum]WEX75656.1 class II aldolase/adducin family protein [Sinorhizobium numidicum]WEX81653.1 class II aldolase/adducin family protein [Sinorhizobium numidicum]
MAETATTDKLALRREMVDICRRMNSSGINQGTAGNLSVRTSDGFLITPSSMAYETMQPEDLVEMDFDGTYVGRRPSSEWRFHRDILRERTDINVVLHCHSIYATTLACHHKTIPSFHYMTGIAGGTTIRCAEYATFGTQALSDNALVALKDRTACLLGQHGQISLGKTLESALWLAIEVETLSRIYVQALTLGEPPVLTDEEMERVIAQMRRMSYGQAPDGEGVNDIARPRGAA